MAQGGLHSARLILYSLDFSEVEQAQREGRWDEAATILGEAGCALKLAGADFLILFTNTRHKVADVVAQRTRLPILYIVDATGNAIIEQGLHRVGLLGTRFVMGEKFYRDRLRQYFGIDILVPGEDEQVIVHWISYDELCQGRLRGASRRDCLEIIEGLTRRGAEGIILGCTNYRYSSALPRQTFPYSIRPDFMLKLR
jgi:aspartate racemase